MKKTLFLTLAIVTICIMASCTKDFNWFTNKITFGDTKDMDVVVYDSTFLSYSNPYPDEPVTVNWLSCRNSIDIDYDGTEDIEFESYGGNFWPFEYVSTDEYFSIHQSFRSNIIGRNAKFYCDQVYVDDYWHSDTTILHSNDTIIAIIEDFDYHKPSSASDIYIRTYQTCVFHPCNAGDQLSEKDFFSPGARPVYTSPYTAYGSEYFINDTLYYRATYCFDDPSFDFPFDEEKYIGLIIKTDDGKKKLGWLKIKLVSHPDGTHRMRLLETAIQK